jgi:hypothetical protein
VNALQDTLALYAAPEVETATEELERLEAVMIRIAMLTADDMEAKYPGWCEITGKMITRIEHLRVTV